MTASQSCNAFPAPLPNAFDGRTRRTPAVEHAHSESCSEPHSAVGKLVIALLVLGVFFGFDANAQSCPSYVPDGSVCVPFHVGEKSYYYPFSLGPYTSEADVISAIRQSFSMDSGCGTTGETVADILPGPYQWEDTYGGIKIRDYWRYSLTRIQQPPNCDQPVDIYFDYVWTRQLSCPDGFEKTTDSSNSEGTCFRTSARPDKGEEPRRMRAAFSVTCTRRTGRTRRVPVCRKPYQCGDAKQVSG